MDLSSKKILICDDSILARKQLKDIISEHFKGIGVCEARNGTEAVEVYKEQRPDLVLLDIVMPQMDGNTAVSAIREFDPEASIIIVSSVGTQVQLRKALEAGAADFIQKPVETAQITKVILKHLS